MGRLKRRDASLPERRCPKIRCLVKNKGGNSVVNMVVAIGPVVSEASWRQLKAKHHTDLRLGTVRLT